MFLIEQISNVTVIIGRGGTKAQTLCIGKGSNNISFYK